MIRNLMRGILMGALIYIMACAIATVRMAHADPLAACEPYRETVMDILEAEGVSRDFYYLMVAESRCRIGAVSPMGAQGFWQLMPSTARAYGCDDPHDLDCATHAAARYLRHLMDDFNDFSHLIMAYCMGGHNLRRRGPTPEALALVRSVRRLMAMDGGGEK